MRRRAPLATQLYQTLFPFRTEGIDPSSFSEHIRKHLIPELRQEVRMFYGDDLSDTLEARFPGLDYTNRIHRLRLCRFPHHRKLFQAIDKLGWTESEIYHFCDWEGTILVKKRYESHHGEIRDTAVDYLYRPKTRTPRRPGWYIRNDETSSTAHSSQSAEIDNDGDAPEDEEGENATELGPTSEQRAESDAYHPQSALAMARQALLASRVSRVTAPSSSSLQVATWGDVEAQIALNAARRTARLESARAAA